MSSPSKGPKWPGSSKNRIRLVLLAAVAPSAELARVLESKCSAGAPLGAPEAWQIALEGGMSSGGSARRWLVAAELMGLAREVGSTLEGATIAAAFSPADCREICAVLLGYDQLARRLEISPRTRTTLDLDAAGVALRELNVPWDETA